MSTFYKKITLKKLIQLEFLISILIILLQFLTIINLSSEINNLQMSESFLIILKFMGIMLVMMKISLLCFLPLFFKSFFIFKINKQIKQQNSISEIKTYPLTILNAISTVSTISLIFILENFIMSLMGITNMIFTFSVVISEIIIFVLYCMKCSDIKNTRKDLLESKNLLSNKNI